MSNFNITITKAALSKIDLFDFFKDLIALLLYSICICNKLLIYLNYTEGKGLSDLLNLFFLNCCVAFSP